MNELELLSLLAGRAGDEKCPVVRVTQGVLREIRARRAVPALDRPTLAAAILSLAAAATFALLAVQSSGLSGSPSAELFRSIQLVLQ
jgi:hypothetical protein